MAPARRIFAWKVCSIPLVKRTFVRSSNESPIFLSSMYSKSDPPMGLYMISTMRRLASRAASLGSTELLGLPGVGRAKSVIVVTPSVVRP